MELDKDTAIERISAGSGKSIEEVQSLISGKKGKFSGLLTDVGAAHMVARELGVEIDAPNGAGGFGPGGGASSRSRGEPLEAKIGKMRPGMNNITLEARVKHAFPSKSFEKGDKKGVLCNLLIEDGSGEIRLTLWNNDAKRFEQEKLERGAAIKLEGCYTTAWNDKVQLNLGFGGSFNIIGQTEVPEVAAEIVKIAALKEGMDNVDLFARVSRIYEERSFEKDGKEGKLLSFELVDETGRARATAWNDLVDDAKKLSAGEAIKVEGGYTKEGLRGIDVNLGWKSRIIRNPKTAKLPELGELAYGDSAPVENKKITKLEDGDFVELEAKVVDLQRGKFHYKVCPKCGKKVVDIDGGLICEGCGEVEEPDMKALVGITLDDGNGVIRAVAFGEQAEKLVGKQGDMFRELLLNSAPEELETGFRSFILGKTVKVRGRSKINPRNEELELVINSVECVSGGEETPSSKGSGLDIEKEYV